MIKIVKDIEKSPTERIRVSVNEYEGHEYVDCRVWFRNNEGEWLPTKKGITLNLHYAEDVIEALQIADKKLRAGG